MKRALVWMIAAVLLAVAASPARAQGHAAGSDADGALSPSVMGRDVTRTVAVEGDRLTLTSSSGVLRRRGESALPGGNEPAGAADDDARDDEASARRARHAPEVTLPSPSR